MTSAVCWHAPSAVERPTSAPSKRKARRRSTAVLFVIVLSPSRSSVSINDEAKIALVGANRPDTGGEAVNPVDACQQRRLGIGRRRKPVIGTRQFLLGNRAD